VGENAIDVVVALGAAVHVLGVTGGLEGLHILATEGEDGLGVVHDGEGTADSVGVAGGISGGVGTDVSANLLVVEGLVPLGGGLGELLVADVGLGDPGVGELLAGVVNNLTVALEGDGGLGGVYDGDSAALGDGLVAGLVFAVVSDGGGGNLGGGDGVDSLDLLGEVTVEEVGAGGTFVTVGLGVVAFEDGGDGTDAVDPGLLGVLDEDGLIGGGMLLAPSWP